MTLAEREEVFGHGPYTSIMSELYSDTQRLLGFSKEQALRTAKAYGCDLGNCQPEQKAAFGKLSKDGRLNIKVVSTMKKVKETYSIRIATVCVELQSAVTLGALLPQGGITLNTQIMEWVNKPGAAKKEIASEQEELAEK